MPGAVEAATPGDSQVSEPGVNASGSVIRVRGARQHNLRNVSVEIPRDRLVVVTGISGSGKSSLAFDTIFAEGQRRYVESLSAYARQFLEQLEKPDVDHIEGLSPSIAIEQKGLGRNPRSTVGTVTEIQDHLRLLFAHVGDPHCSLCGRPIVSQTVPEMVDRLMALPDGQRFQVLAPVVRGRKGKLRKELDGLRRSGFVRARIDGEVRDLEESIDLERGQVHTIEAVVDRLVRKDGIERRLADSLEVALREGEGTCRVLLGGDELVFSEHFACSDCGISLPEISPRLFSFNSPYGACPTCGGLGEHRFLAPELVVPDESLALSRGAIRPWGRKLSTWHLHLLTALARALGFDLDTPFRDLSAQVRKAVLDGTGEREIDFVHERSGRRHVFRRPFEGVLALLRKRAGGGGREAARDDLGEYMSASPCRDCGGARLRPEARAVTIVGKGLVDVTAFPVGEALRFFTELDLPPPKREVARLLLAEITSRLGFLVEVGLDYLTLDRPAQTLSGGEGQRLRLATQIGTRLVGVLYVLDEPSIGLHARDNERLLGILKRLRDLGNTVLVVEHDRDTILAADYVVDMGPGAGEHGGEVIAAGSPELVARAKNSVTGHFLSGRRSIATPSRRRSGNGFSLSVRGVRRHNLQGVGVDIPLGTMTCVTGVSGSGKSSLVLDSIAPALAARLSGGRIAHPTLDELDGWQLVDKVVHVDQTPIGRTPRSNPATYIGLFTPIRELFAETPDARLRGYEPGRFSFNVKGGRCEACKGDGLVRIEMHFLPDMFVICEQCSGRRYERETLEVRFKGRNIAEVLDLTVTEARDLFAAIPAVMGRLAILEDVGVGYLRLGQSATTLSGGEAQRIKLARELARRSTGKTFYILDEPTTGLHFADIECLLGVLGRLVDAGNTVVVIEHNLDVIKCADHVIDLGPEGGSAGGRVVASGTPEEIASSEASHTGRFLRTILGTAVRNY